MDWWQYLILTSLTLLALLAILYLLLRMVREIQTGYSESTKTLTGLIEHQVNLIASKDPLAFQAIAVPTDFGYATPDPSDEAEIARLRERGVSDGAILDEWSGDSNEFAAEVAAARSELSGEPYRYE